MAATAKRDDCSARQTEGLAFLIHNLKITFQANGTIAENRYFCSGQENLQKRLCRLCGAVRFQDSWGRQRLQERGCMISSAERLDPLGSTRKE
ncbi:MAG TPA: hypothetical protein VMH89_12470, partial [Candidatus Acidoferrum sp.]|nr:hypothetical protein [Candidatus Acidoferrum sp.]